MRTVVLTAIILVFGGLNASAREFTSKDLSTVECGTTFYAWSETVDKAPAEIATGLVKNTGDGQGKWIKGQLVLQLLSLPNTASDKTTCVYNLVDGGYTIGRNGSGISHNSWKLADGSDPRCASLHLDWFAKGGMDPALKSRSPNTAWQTIYLNAANSGYQLATGPAGFAAGTCRPQP